MTFLPLIICTPQIEMHPPEQAVHPLKPFSIKTQYLFHKRDGNSDRIAVPFRFDGRADEAGGLSALLRAARLTLLARGRIIVPTEALRGCYKRSRERETERCLVRLYWLAKMPATTAPP